MSGYGWNSGYGNLNGGFNRAHPTYPNPGQERCVLCNQVCYTTEALINHYDAHMREDELALRATREGNLPPVPFHQPLNPLHAPPPAPHAILQNNYGHVPNQLAPQRNLALGPNQPFIPALQPLQPPLITRAISQALMQPPQAHALPITRPINPHAIMQPTPPAPPLLPQKQQQQQLMQPAAQGERGQNLVPPNAQMRARVPDAQANDQAAAARPDEIELDFADGDNRSPDSSINLDLTLDLN